MIEWQILDTGIGTAAENMAKDAELLQNLSGQNPILHLYSWKRPSATYGHFIQPEKLLHPDGLKKQNVEIAKRPTGGGVLFHTCDLAFSVLVPAAHAAYSSNTLENYAFVNRIAAKAVHRFLGAMPSLLPQDPAARDEKSGKFCMAKPTIYDIMLEGRKVGGAAQRRTKRGFLHQGSISIAAPPLDFLQDILADEHLIQAMMQQGFYLLKENAGDAAIQQARQALCQCLVEEATANTC